MTLDPAKMVAKKDDSVIALSRREFAIIHALMQNPGMIFLKAGSEESSMAGRRMWSNTIEVHIHKLRSKLGAGFIETVRGALATASGGLRDVDPVVYRPPADDGSRLAFGLRVDLYQHRRRGWSMFDARLVESARMVGSLSATARSISA